MKVQLREIFVVLMVFTPFGSSYLTTISIGTFNSPEPGVSICKSKPDGTLLPINGDCLHYWYCSAGKAIKLPCTPGMEFSPTARECVRIELSDCDETNVNTTYPISTTTPTTTTEDQTNLPPGITKNPCTELPNQIRHPYPFNCSAFMRCVDNKPVLDYCPFDKKFNPIILVCDDGDDAGCQEVDFPEAIDAFANQLDTMKRYDICEHQQISKKIAYPEKCKKYIACDHPVPIAYYCCDNLAFNCIYEICDIPENVGCSADVGTTAKTKPAIPSTTIPATTPSQPTTSVSEHPNSCHVKSANSFIPYPNSCVKYIQCTVPIPIAGYCPNGYKFNELFEICDVSEDVHCSMETISYSRIPKI